MGRFAWQGDAFELKRLELSSAETAAETGRMPSIWALKFGRLSALIACYPCETPQNEVVFTAMSGIALAVWMHHVKQ